MQMNGWRSPVFAKMKGLDHVKNGTECQDYVDVLNQKDYTIAVLADGIGSKALSQYAATEAVKGTINWFRLHWDEFGNLEDPKEGIKKIRSALLPELRKRIEEMAIKNNLNLNQMDCNLAFVFLRKNPDGEDQVYFGVLGDCAVCVIRDGDRMETLCGALEGGLATDSVMYLGSQENFKIWHKKVDEDKICGFLLTTDGLEYVAYVKRSPYVYNGAQEYYNAIFNEKPEERLNSLFMKLQENPYFSDDLSVAVLSRDRGPRTFDKDPTWLCKCGYRNAIYAIRCGNCRRDYLDMYGDLRKDIVKHGYKDAHEYFRKYLNQNPDQERLRLGLAPSNLSNQNQPKQERNAGKGTNKAAANKAATNTAKKETTAKDTGAGTEHDVRFQAKDDRKETTKQKKSGRSGIGCALRRIACGAVVALFLANLVISVINLQNGREIRRMREDLSAQLQEVQITLEQMSLRMEPVSVPQEEQETFRVELEDGSVYYGPVKNGVPHGYGMVQMEDRIMYGRMLRGKKDGTFWLRGVEDPDMLSVVNFASDVQVGEMMMIGPVSGRANVMTSCLISADAKGYDECDQKSDVVAEFSRNTLVYLTGQYDIVNKIGRGGMELWVEVCTADGVLCWCKASEIGMYQP